MILDPENTGDTFLQNVGSNTDYKQLYPRRWQRSAYTYSTNQDLSFRRQPKELKVHEVQII
jgi:hypothetical protein